jgi:hypothetical protein
MCPTQQTFYFGKPMSFSQERNRTGHTSDGAPCGIMPKPWAPRAKTCCSEDRSAFDQSRWSPSQTYHCTSSGAPTLNRGGASTGTGTPSVSPP